MEYELHSQLMNKLKLRNMNALFGLRIQISVGENMLLGLAVGWRCELTVWLASCKRSSQSASLWSVCHRSVSHSPASTWGDPDRREDSQWLEQWAPRPDHPEKDQWHHSQKQGDLSDQPSGETTRVLLGLVVALFPQVPTHLGSYTLQKAFTTFLRLPESWVQL